MFRLDNNYATELEGLHEPWRGDVVPDPKMVKLNSELARELGLDPEALDTPEGAVLFTGSQAIEGATPIAQAYAGHQFGGFSPRLGDGRAMLLGEFVAADGTRRDLHLKGSGRTSFSRGGDGKAAVGPVLREYLVGEFMHAVGVPTTRSLAAITTGETVLRERALPGAILARVASSHLRIGTFQYLAAQGDSVRLRKLADYAIKRHYPELVGTADVYLEFLRAVVDRQALLVAKWMSIGFVHGVMNTDNMTISGETIDYGPCAFMDSFDSGAVFSGIDQGGRYCYRNQTAAAQWNLSRFAETLLEAMNPSDPHGAIDDATVAVGEFQALYDRHLSTEMATKLGLDTTASDRGLMDDLFEALDADGVDFTQFFRGLGETLRGADPQSDADMTLRGLVPADSDLSRWVDRWRARQGDNKDAARRTADAMDRVNPIYVPRNHKVEETLEAGTVGDYAPFGTLLALLNAPFTRIEGKDDFAQPAPDGFGPYTTHCGT